MQITFFLLDRRNKGLDEGDTLPRVFRAVHEKSVVPVLLKLSRLLAKRAANTLAELQVGSRLGRIEIGETFSAEIFHLREKFLEVSYPTSKIFNRGDFGPRARRF